MNKCKNKEHSSLPQSFLERTTFLEIQSVPVSGLLLPRPQKVGKKMSCQENFTTNLHFSAFFYANCFSKGTLRAKYNTDVHIKCIQWRFDCWKCLWMDNWSIIDSKVRWSTAYFPGRFYVSDGWLVSWLVVWLVGW